MDRMGLGSDLVAGTPGSWDSSGEDGFWMAEPGATGIVVVGPRKLPRDGRVRVWMDSGSGGGSHIDVLPQHLALAESDSGEGTVALYNLTKLGSARW